MDFKKNPKTTFNPIDQLSKDEASEEIRNLREGIHYHDYLYYVKNQPQISDAVYDKLFKRLQELEAAFPEFQSEDSPTRRIGAEPIDELGKVEHTRPMLSLNAALDEKEAKNFTDFIRRNSGQKRVDYTLEPKFDGVSVEIVYENGVFRYGATRGDGYAGEDVSENLKTIRTIPLHLQTNTKHPSFLAVRGEVYLPKNRFAQLNKTRIQQGAEPFANPRNAAAGIIRQLDPGRVADKHLDILFYEILDIREDTLKTHWKALAMLAEWGLKTDRHNKKCTSYKKIQDYHDAMAQQRDTLDYEIDGIVVKVNDYQIREHLGTRHRSPRWAFAWKFAPKAEVTTLEEIVIQVGRTGILTPVALLQPVDVGGVTVSRATLHNEDEVARKDVRPGDKVRIQRAGDVIPEVTERLSQPETKRSRPFSMPNHCPACDADVFREGAYWFCSASLACPAQLIGRIMHYTSKEAMDIQGLGEQTVRQLVNRNLVNELADLYKLSPEQLKTLEGFASQSARQLHRAIQTAKEAELDRFLYALGIRHVGRHIARVLAQEFKTLNALENADVTDIRSIPEAGPEIARSIVTFFEQSENRQAVKHLLDVGLRIKRPPAAKAQKPSLAEKTFVFTGELEHYTRRQAKEAVEQLGARAASSVSSNTDYVVVGDNPGRKLDEAKENDAAIIDEQEFEKILHR